MTTPVTPLVSRSLPQSTSHSLPPTPVVPQVPHHSAAHSPSLLSTGSTTQMPQTITTHQVSRTTKWRRSKNPEVRQHKVYLCKYCGEPTAGHRQERGHRYCPQQPGQVPLEEWRQLIKNKKQSLFSTGRQHSS